jgi:Tfp pilus assembly protein PilF
LNRNEEALSEFDRAVNLDPKNPYRYSSRAFFKDRTSDLAGAIEDYEIAIALDPEDAVSLNNKGIVEEKLGYIAKSKKSFEKADQLIGYDPQAIKQTESNKFDAGSSPISGEKTKKMDLSYYFQTLTSIVQDPKSRRDFVGFLKTLISGKNIKKT